MPAHLRVSMRLILLILLAMGRSDVCAAENIKVAFATLSSSYMDHLAALEKGYYREEGLDLEVIRAGGGVATPALMSGELQFSTSAGSALSAMIKGGPLKVIYTNLSWPSYKLVSNKPELKTIKDLVGKRVGINTLGDTGHLSTLLLLKKYGVQASSVLFITLGRNELRLAALKAGSVDAVPLTPSDLLQLGQPKGEMLADVSKEVQLIWTGVATSNKLLVENRELAERFLRGAVKGREFARRYKEQTIGIIAKYDRSPREAIDRDYDTTLSSMTEEGWVGGDVLRDEVSTRAELMKAANPADLSKLFDYSIVKKIYGDLKSSGWKPKP